MIIRNSNSNDLVYEGDMQIKGSNSGDIKCTGRVEIRGSNSGDVYAESLLIEGSNSGYVDGSCVTLDGYNSGTVRSEEIKYQGWLLTPEMLRGMKQKMEKGGLVLSRQSAGWELQDSQGNLQQIKINRGRVVMRYVRESGITINGSSITISTGNSTVNITRRRGLTIID